MDFSQSSRVVKFLQNKKLAKASLNPQPCGALSQGRLRKFVI